MVTFNGIECHNEWEITFEEIHRNGDIAFAIYLYTKYTGDKSYVLNEGAEVLTEISRFWADRVHYSQNKNKYMLHAVTGPDEYDNNVNNDWYTNLLCRWTLQYTLDILDQVDEKVAKKLNVSEDEKPVAGMLEEFSQEENEITVGLLYEQMEKMQNYIDELLAHIESNEKESKEEIARLQEQNQEYKRALVNIRTFMEEEGAKEEGAKVCQNEALVLFF